jgi:ankyrin repeat protein
MARRSGILRLLFARASAVAAASVGLSTAECKTPRRNTSNPNGLNDADWYQEQAEHIALNLPLVEEAKQGWWHEVTRRLRQNGEDANARDPSDGVTLLHLASACGRRRLVEELLTLGAVHDARDVRGRTPLHYAAEVGNESVAATLAASAAESFDVNTQGTMPRPNEQQRRKGSRTNVRQSRPPLVLVRSADDSGATALSVSARLGHVRLVRWLCARKDLAPCAVDKYGVTALAKAVSFGHAPCVDALLSDGRVRANIDQPVGTPTVPASYQALSGGETALHLAAGHTYHFHHTQHTRIARALLDAGADPLATTATGRNACHCAAAAGNVAVLRELATRLPRSAAWSARDSDGRTPRDLAKGNDAALAAMPAGRKT